MVTTAALLPAVAASTYWTHARGACTLQRRTQAPGVDMHMDLTAEESKALKHALEVYLSDLRMEIVDTDSQDFRDGLKHEKQLLESVVGKIRL
jgi:hypothetical protein